MQNKTEIISTSSLSKLSVVNTDLVKSSFFEKVLKDVKSKVKDFDSILSFDEYANVMCLEVNWGEFDPNGAEDNIPWIEACNIPQLIKSMSKVGFKISYFKKIPPSTKKFGRKKIQVAESLAIGFVKKVPKSKRS